MLFWRFSLSKFTHKTKSHKKVMKVQWNFSDSGNVHFSETGLDSIDADRKKALEQIVTI